MLQIPALLAVGDGQKTIRKIAIGCGAADDFVGNAADAGADALLLGEARFHACLEARARGIGLILAGHYATERFAACILADRIARKFPALSVKASEQESDPIRVV
jgi:putative NIF3 family GTP cyclohydrolase 1 type 2